ncbi:MAG: PIN domain-containing protein [Actinomycetota bacterium]|nr:PIN domain-containing protein [Actinomycetota bacterium]
MTVLADTSALYAFLDGDDANHLRATAYFQDRLGAAEPLLTHNYVVVEAAALVQRRLGSAAVRALLEDVAPRLGVVWVDEELHRAAVAALLAAVRRRVSLVDWMSFEVMRRRGIDAAFAFDRDFAAQGFRTLP